MNEIFESTNAYPAQDKGHKYELEKKLKNDHR